MAFRQSKFALPRQSVLPKPPDNTPIGVPEEQQRAFEESQEWVLFSPHSTHSSSQTETNFTAWPSQTAGLSRLSDFGSLDTAARSGQYGEDVSDAGDGATGDDEDLDSLDEGLHAFQDSSMYQSLANLDQSRSILPAHDGLGTFPASSLSIQDQIWRFEQYNPRQSPIEQLRRPIVQRNLDAVDDDDGSKIEVERIERIERWRSEQSKILLDEIEKETRKRSNSTSDYSRSLFKKEQATNHIDHTVNPDKQSRKVALGIEGIQTADNESLWERITRRIIRDFLGIDDALLNIIFGESLHSDSYFSQACTSSPSSPNLLNDPVTWLPNPSWDTRCLDRLARESGFLVKHLSRHPGAFSTPLDPAKSDYAGIPISNLNSPKAQSVSSTTLDESGAASSASPYFKPTLQDHPLRQATTTSETTHAALWGVEEKNSSIDAQDHEYWERTPNVRTIFRLLQHRFTTPRQTPKSNPTIATTATPTSLRRAAVIRQHHPLVSRPMARRNRGSLLHSHHNGSQLYSFKRPDSSCASISVRKGKKGTGSSRNYWDLGGSGVGSGSAVAAAGGLGAWGEV